MALGLGLGLSKPYFAGGESFLLDTYTGAAAAYSLRQLSESTTNVVRVRRSSDDSEQDFTASEITDGTLTTFTGAGDGFVVTWYDQSGNARNATQAILAEQPQIVNAGSVITRGSRPALQWDNTDDNMATSAFGTPIPQPTTWAAVCSIGAVSSSNVIADGVAVTNRQIPYAQVTSGTVKDYIFAGVNLFGSNSTAGHKLFFTLFNGASSTLHNNGTLSASGNAGTNAVGGITIGTTYLKAEEWDDKIQEIILWPSDQSANRTTIQEAIADYYSITLA